MQVNGYEFDVYEEAQALNITPWDLIGCPDSAGHPAWLIWRRERQHVLAHELKVRSHREQERQAVKKATGRR